MSLMQDGQTRVQPYRENERKPRTHSEHPGPPRAKRPRAPGGRRARAGGRLRRAGNRRAAPECGSVLPTVPRFLLSGIRRRAAEKRRHVGIGTWGSDTRGCCAAARRAERQVAVRFRARSPRGSPAPSAARRCSESSQRTK